MDGTVEEGNANVAGDAVEEGNTNVTFCSSTDARGDGQKRQKVDYVANDEGSWTCLACTYIHDVSNQTYLACEICGTERT